MTRTRLFSLILFTAISVCGLRAQSSFQLKTADSLYQAQRYTQSFEHYSQILSKKQYTPAMLLRMAYIQEGLGNIGSAMYYLNLYFIATNDKAAHEKMEELAGKYNLEGYQSSDGERALIFYHDQYNYITMGLAAIITLMLSVMFYTRTKLRVKPVVSGTLLFVFLAILFVHLNFGERVDRGILVSQRVYIMEGPSSGAPVIAVTNGGHRVEVIGKKDVWLKILWDGKTGFVRDRALLPIEL